MSAARSFKIFSYWPKARRVGWGAIAGFVQSSGLTGSKRILVLAGLAALACLWGVIWNYSKDLRDAKLTQARRDTGNLALAFEENLQSLLDEIDQQMFLIKRRFERERQDFDLMRAVSDLPKLRNAAYQIATVDAQGTITASTLGPIVTPVNIFDRLHFQVHLVQDTDAIYIGTPVFARMAQRPAIQITRRLNGPEGEFAGVLVISLDPAALSSFSRNVDLGPGGIIVVVGHDGIVRARAGPEVGISDLGKAVPNSPMMLLAPRVGNYITRSHLDGVERVTSYRDLPNYPLVVAVGASTDEVLREPDQQVRDMIMVGVAATILIILTSHIALRAVARRDEHEQELRISASRFKDFARSASEVQWETDAEDRFTWFSVGADDASRGDASKMIGVRREDLATNPNDANWQWYRETIRDRLPFRDFVAERRRADGGRWYLRSSGVPVFSDDGEFMGYRGVSSDVTAEQEALRKLKATEVRLRGMSQNLPGVVYQTWRAADGSGFRYTYMSERSQEYFGCTPEEAYADSERAHVNIHPDDRELIDSKIDMIPPLDQPWGYSYRIIVNGEVRWMQSITRSRRDTDGSIISDRVAFDITENKEREKQIIIAQQRAELANKSKDSFLAHVSHELRTPLNAILGFSEVIRDKIFGSDEERYVSYAALIHGSGSHLLSIINNLLDLSRIDAGRYEMDETDVSISLLLGEALELVGVLAERRSLTIQKRILVEGAVRADRRYLLQILINILSNAIKFTAPGGEVRLCAALEEDGRMTIAVIDNGIGMNEEELNHAFEPFRRGDAMIRQEAEGTGLGLPICKLLVELHGGSIVIDSAPGSGTSVTITMPAARCSALRSCATVGAADDVRLGE